MSIPRQTLQPSQGDIIIAEEETVGPALWQPTIFSGFVRKKTRPHSNLCIRFRIEFGSIPGCFRIYLSLLIGVEPSGQSQRIKSEA